MKNLIYTIIFSFITISCQLSDAGNNTDEKPMISITDSITNEDFTASNYFYFDATCEKESSENTFKITNSGNKKLVIYSIYVEGSSCYNVNTSETIMELAAEESTKFKATFAPVDYRNSIEATKIIVSSNAFNKNQYVMNISARGVLARNIIEVYESIIYPKFLQDNKTFYIDKDNLINFKIKNSVNALFPLNIYAIEFHGSDAFKLDSISDMNDNLMELSPAESSAYFEVSYLPESRGIHTGYLLIKSDYTHDDTFIINFEGTYQ